MKSKTRYFPEHSLLQEAITELMLGLCQDCVTPGDAMPRMSLTFPDRFRVLLGSEAPVSGVWQVETSPRALGRLLTSEACLRQGNHEAVKPGARRQKGPQRRTGLQSVFTHSLRGTTPADPCLAWSFFTLQVSASRPQPLEGFPKPTVPKGALPTAHHPCIVTFRVFETVSLARASLKLSLCPLLELQACTSVPSCPSF